MNIKTFFKQFWPFLFLVIAILILLPVSFILKKRSTIEKGVFPSTSPISSPPSREIIPSLSSPIPSFFKTEAPSWKKIIPQKSDLASVKKELGTPLKEYQQGNYLILDYPFSSSQKSPPQKIYLQNDLVALIIERIDYKQSLNLNTYKEKYGNSAVRYGQSLGNGWPINVFANQGLAVTAHLQTGAVFEIWYFNPMTQELFDQTLGKDLTITQSQQF